MSIILKGRARGPITLEKIYAKKKKILQVETKTKKRITSRQEDSRKLYGIVGD